MLGFLFSMFVITLVVVHTTGQLSPTEDKGENMYHEINDFKNFSTPDSHVIRDYEQYCPKNHLCTKSNGTSPDFQNSCCAKCSCSYDCDIAGDCCPDVLGYVNRTERFKCLHMQLDVSITETWLNRGSTAVLTKCPDNYSNNFIRESCELDPNYPSSRSDFLDFHLFVASETMVYRNKYCAICNEFYPNENNFFSTDIRCAGASRLHFSSINDLFLKLPSSDCILVYNYPSNLNITVPFPSCNWGYISQCNQTGKMTSYDTSLDYVCPSFTSVFNGTYRNVFCYLCNEPDAETTTCSYDDGMKPYNFLSFTAVMDFNNNYEEDDEDIYQLNLEYTCEESQNQFYDAYTVSIGTQSIAHSFASPEEK